MFCLILMCDPGDVNGLSRQDTRCLLTAAWVPVNAGLDYLGLRGIVALAKGTVTFGRFAVDYARGGLEVGATVAVLEAGDMGELHSVWDVGEEILESYAPIVGIVEAAGRVPGACR